MRQTMPVEAEAASAVHEAAPFDDVAELAAQICGASAAVVLLRLDDGLRLGGSWGLGVPADDPARWAGLDEMASSDPDQALAVAAGLVPSEIRFCAAQSLQDDEGRRRGSLWVFDGQARPQGLTEPQAKGLKTLAHQLACRLALSQTLRERRHSEARLTEALEASQLVGAWHWEVGTDRLTADARFAELYGVDAEAARSGLPIADFTGRFYDEDRERVTEEIRAAVRSGEPLQTEYRLKLPDGDRWILARGRCRRVADARIAVFTGVAIDITERKASEQALEEAHRQAEAAATERAAILSQLAEGVIVTDAEGRITFVNDAAEQIHGLKRLGVGPADYAHDYSLLTEAGDPYPSEQLPLARAVIAGETVNDARWRVRRPSGEEVLAVGSARPLRSADGAQIGAVLTIRDETARVEAELALARAAAALLESEAKFRAIADSLPQMVWSTLPDGHHDYYNARWYEFTGVPVGSTDGEGWNGMFHPDDQARAWETWRQSLETGQPYEIEYRLRRHDGVYRWTLGRAMALRDDQGRIMRWFGTCTDIDDLKRIEQAQELLSQELSHRIKNIFAVTSALIGLSARQFPDARAFAEGLRTRIGALARAHEFVRPHTEASAPSVSSSTLHAFLHDLFAPYAEVDQTRISVEGQDAIFDDQSATPVALLFHELMTNATKYGALSNSEGRVRVETRIEGDTLLLTWTEVGGPPVTAPPQREGFGSTLALLSVETQLGGTLKRDWAREGLRVEARVPVAALSRRRALKS